METILLVEDDPLERQVLKEVLREDGLRLLTASSGLEALEILRDDSIEKPKVVILDWTLPGMAGIDLLKWIKEQPRLGAVEVIMLSARTAEEDIRAGIKGGAFYYLTKPFRVAQLQAIVRAAIADSDQKRSLLAKIQQSQDAFRLLKEGTFRLRNLLEAEALTVGLSHTCETGQKGLGIFELLVNAVEHGNLGITYEEKSRLLQEGLYEEEVARRLDSPRHIDKFVEVRVSRKSDRLEVLIIDSGPGFDFKKYLTFDQERAFDANGRGILLATKLLGVEFIPPGNRVRVRVPLAEESH